MTDHTGQTALHWSAVRGANQVAELLLQEGARVNAADMNGYQVGFILFLLILNILALCLTYQHVFLCNKSNMELTYQKNK